MDRSADWIDERSATSWYDIDHVSLFLFGVTAFLIVELFERDWNFLITCLNWAELPSRLDVDSWAMSHGQWLTLYLHWYNLAFRLNKDKYFLFDLQLKAVGSFLLDGWKYHIIKKGMNHQFQTWIALCTTIWNETSLSWRIWKPLNNNNWSIIFERIRNRKIQFNLRDMRSVMNLDESKSYPIDLSSFIFWSDLLLSSCVAISIIWSWPAVNPMATLRVSSVAVRWQIFSVDGNAPPLYDRRSTKLSDDVIR